MLLFFPHSKFMSYIAKTLETKFKFFPHQIRHATEVGGVPKLQIPVPEADGYDRKLQFDTPFFNDVEIGGVSVDWSTELSNEVVLTWINAWRSYESYSNLDGDFSLYPAVHYQTDVELEQVSSEFRITSPVGDVFDWQVGLYYYDSEMDTAGENGFLPLMGSLFLGDVFPGGFWPDGGVNFDTNTHPNT